MRKFLLALVSRFRSSPNLAARPMRTSESKDTSNAMILVPLEPEVRKRTRGKRGANFGFAALGALLFSGAAAHAHAYLDHANPRVGSTVRTAPRVVSLSFTQKLEASFSSAQVTDASGARVDHGSRVSGMQIHVSVKALPPGSYRVHWRVLSVDTHTTEGNFSFRVGQ
jgi:methionine-rich copper-binding protein CopC